ncbi:MAG: leucine--tRNA ligase [Planctomycetota bacterium]
MKYDFLAIEPRWQQHWDNARTFATPNPGGPEFDPAKPKYYVLDMFPYPSGVGLHVGHPLGYIATDIVARYKKMRGFNVLHPMGFDAFGLPAEQYAVETGVHPRVTTEHNIKNMVGQLKRLGMGYDWDRTLATTDPAYVRWTQWIFLQMYHSYFDPLEQKALPIRELIGKLEGEDYYVGMDGELIVSGDMENMEALAGIGNPLVHKWHELTPDQRVRLLDEYRLAFMAEVEVNWCPGLGTVLANEEVTNEGRSERGNFPVFKRPLKQWMLRITAYADRLIDDLDGVDWPANIKLLQRNWIGKSVGAEVDFTIVREPGRAAPDNTETTDTPEDRPDTGRLAEDTIRVFTTRPDTLFGATYMVLAPEHPLVELLTKPEQAEAVRSYQQQAAEKTDIDRQADAKSKTGVFTGGYAINPVNGQRIPVWVADYVMMGYGTGAIMAVPAHDERDHAFATQFGLPVVPVVMPTDAWLKEHRPDNVAKPEHDISQFRRVYLKQADQWPAWVASGSLINSENDEISINGHPVSEAKQKITAWIENKGVGNAKVNYKLRDWLFSRQRYWGEPFPILHGPDGEIVPVPEDQLPVSLPEMEDFKPEGTDDPDAPPQPPLGRAGDDWKKVVIDGVEYTRELNTMPNWAGSCWYYLRYCDPANHQRLIGEDAEAYWMVSEKASGEPHAGGIDLYVGGAEHAVLHLLYARFWHKFLHDIGVATTPEPFGKYFAQGYIQAYCYRDERGIPVDASKVVTEDGRPAAEVQGDSGTKFFFEGQPVTEEFGKMGKSLKNATAPDAVCQQYGCDTMRLYEMYMGPLEQSKVWNPADIIGVHRFLNRLWRVVIDEETGAVRVGDIEPGKDLNRKVHATIKRVTEAMETMNFNVAIAAMIELNNALVGLASGGVPRFAAESLLRLVNPIAPHIAEELWAKLGHETYLADSPWPGYDASALVVDEIELPVQVNGKLRGKITVPAEAGNSTIEIAARANENVAEHLEGKEVRKIIVVPQKLINIVVN